MSHFLRDYLTVVWFGARRVLLAGLLLGVAALIRPQRPNNDEADRTTRPASTRSATAGRRARSATTSSPCCSSIFDVEAVFIFPWAAPIERYGRFGLVEMGVFIVLLLDGLVYAWKRGLLRWV